VVGKDLAGHESVNIADAKLRQAAVEAVKQWRYRPYLVNGEPTELDTSAVLPFDFRQPGSSSSNPPARVPESGPQFGEFTKIQIDRKVLQTRQVTWEEPKYPQMAKLAHIEGIVVIRVLIDKEGHVAQEKGVMGHPILMQAALDAVRQWIYLPFLADGEAAAIESSVVLRFRMDGVKQD
jgi:TonB family protein